MSSTTKLTVGLILMVAGVFAVIELPQRLSYAIERGRAQARYDAAAAELAKMGEQVRIVRSISEVFNVVARKVEPSVVHIIAERAPQAGPAPELDLRRFFGDEDFPLPFNLPQPRQQPRRYIERATGSGVIISRDGYVLTNNHVVAEATRVTVRVTDGEEETYDAKVVGADVKTDVAVIKIEGGKSFNAAELGDSDSVQVGDWVLAIGSPFGLDRSVTSGIISAVGRQNVGIADYEDFIQTDASINPGNSGGPLVDMAGKVVGMNTAIASRSGGNQGVGFAIPINMIRQLLPRLQKGESIQRGYLGVLIQPLTRKLADSFGYDSTKGALISQVLPDSPSKDRLKVGDIVHAVNGKDVADPNELRTTVAAIAPGKDIELGVFRDGKKVSVTIKLGELPASLTRTGGVGPPEQADARKLLGLEVQTLTRDLARQLGLGDNVKGVVITAVDPASEAAREGLSNGDVITQAGNEPVKSAEEFAAALARIKDKQETVRLLVTSRAGSRFVLLPLAKK